MKRTLVALLLVFLYAGLARADFLVSFPSALNAWQIGSTGVVTGYEFTPSVDVLVSSLGWNDLNNTDPNGGPDGFQAPHQVGIYRSSDQALLASVTLPAGTAAPLSDGSFRYGGIAPLLLTAGTTYVLAGTTNGWVNGTSVLEPTQTRILGTSAFINPLFTTGSQLIGLSSNPTGLEFPSFVLAGGSNVIAFGGNLQFGVVPEPSSYCLMGLGVAGALTLVATRLRRA